MATKRVPIGADVNFDDSVYPSRYDLQLTLTNVKKQICYVMQAPAGSDIGFHFTVRVPDDYASGPKMVFRGVIDGTPANVFGVGVQLLARAVSEIIDTAYETEDTASNSSWTGYVNEDEFEISVTLTPSVALVAGETLYLYAYRDDSVDSQTIPFLLNPSTSGFEYTTT